MFNFLYLKGSGELKKEINLRRAGLSKRLTKEMSLDEDAGRRKSRSEMKRMSCDNLPWKMEKNCGKSKFVELQLSRDDETKNEAMTDIIMKSLDDKIGQTKETLDGNKDSKENTGNKLFLSVPKLQPARNRSGSTKQLFKQKAMDDEQEIDENSLLLPSKSSKQSDYWDGKEMSSLMPDRSDSGENKVSKSDSSEILRIISERRMLEKRDIVDSSENFEYNQLMGKKSPHTTTTSIN